MKKRKKKKKKIIDPDNYFLKNFEQNVCNLLKQPEFKVKNLNTCQLKVLYTRYST